MNYFRELRSKSKKSISELSNLLGITKVDLMNYEHERIKPDEAMMDKVNDLYKSLGVELTSREKLLCETEQEIESIIVGYREEIAKLNAEIIKHKESIEYYNFEIKSKYDVLKLIEQEKNRTTFP